MALRLRELVNDQTLGLTVLTGTDALDRRVDWVHSTELADPVAFLEGGEHAGSRLLELLAPDAAATFAEAVLTPLWEYDAAKQAALVSSLHCWLEQHGHWDHTADRFGVHRQAHRPQPDTQDRTAHRKTVGLPRRAHRILGSPAGRESAP